MKPLIINCSPRVNGNSDILTDALSHTFDVDTIKLREYKYSPCDGCEACNVIGKCRHNDDATTLYGDIEKRDTILFVAPIYFFGFDAHTKAFIDRSQYKLASKPEKKNIYLIAIGGTKPTLGFECMAITLKSYGFKEYVDGIYLGEIDTKGEINKGNSIKRAVDFLNKSKFPKQCVIDS